MENQKITYYIRFEENFTNLPEAGTKLRELNKDLDLEIGYYMPQPKYKNWVPNWLIRLIIKH
jgi:hypothetical protein